MDENRTREKRTALYTTARVLMWLLKALFFPVTYHGAENVELNAPYIVLSNHRHWLDPLLIAAKIKRYEVRFMGKKELASGKLSKWALTKMHMIIVDRHHSDIAAMRACVSTVKEGHVLGIFPEGTRRKDTLMKEIETGSAFIALRSKAPLIPVLIDKPVKLWRRTNVYFGAPIKTDDLYAAEPGNDTVRLLDARIVESIRGLVPPGEKMD